MNFFVLSKTGLVNLSLIGESIQQYYDDDMFWHTLTIVDNKNKIKMF